MRKETATLLFIFITGLLISFLYCPWFEIYFDDKEIFRYAGMAIVKGGIPYIDFFDHKPPLIFFLNTIHYKYGPWAFWIFDTLAVCYTAFVFCKLCIKSGMKYAFVLPVIFLLLIRNPVLSFGTGMTREYTTLFLLIFLSNLFSNGKTKHVAGGVLIGLAFFMQQDQVVLFLPFLTYAFFQLFKVDRKAALLFLVKLFTGFVIVAIPVLLYFAANHGLAAFWQDAFLFNFNWYTEKISPYKTFALLHNLLSVSKTDYIFYSTLILLIVAFLSFLKSRKVIATAIITIFLSFISQYLSGKLSIGLSLQYYALPIAATLPFGLYILFTQTDFLLKAKETHLLFYSMIMSFPLILILLQHAANTPKQDKMGMKNEAEAKYLSAAGLKDHEFFSAFNAHYDFIFNEQEILSPSPWLYLSFWEWHENWDPKNEKLKNITNDLDKYQTKFIENFADSNKIKNKENFKFWNEYVQKNYTPVLLPDSNYSKILMRRKNLN